MDVNHFDLTMVASDFLHRSLAIYCRLGEGTPKGLGFVSDHLSGNLNSHPPRLDRDFELGPLVVRCVSFPLHVEKYLGIACSGPATRSKGAASANAQTFLTRG